jgi:hypothetical protein
MFLSRIQQCVLERHCRQEGSRIGDTINAHVGTVRGRNSSSRGLILRIAHRLIIDNLREDANLVAG